MSRFAFEKQPSEETTYAIDVTGFRELQQGETVSSVNCAITLDGVAAPGILVSCLHSDGVIYTRVQAGVSPNTYDGQILITTSGGHVREIDFLLVVKEV